jgi:hypothetical protein
VPTKNFIPNATGFRKRDCRGTAFGAGIASMTHDNQPGKEKFFLFNCLESRPRVCACMSIGTSKCGAADQQDMYAEIIHRRAGRGEV